MSGDSDHRVGEKVIHNRMRDKTRCMRLLICVDGSFRVANVHLWTIQSSTGNVLRHSATSPEQRLRSCLRDFPAGPVVLANVLIRGWAVIGAQVTSIPS